MKQKFCITSTASFREINSSLNNKSKTKQTFTFGVTPRFQSLKPVCQQSTYGGDFIKRRPVATGIGYGTRSDFTKCLTISPSSTKYKLSSQFETNQQKKKGSTIGFSRDKVAFNQYIDRQLIKMPPSTKYEFEQKNRQRAPSYTLRQKTRVLDRSMTLDPQKYNPGPGTYNKIQTNRTSKFQQITYGTGKRGRFDSADNKVPGAGSYQNQVKLSGVGKYSNSKYKGGTQAKFMNSLRSTYFDASVKAEKDKPGPGNYKTPSEFGQYDGDVYGKTEMSRFSRKK